MHDEGVRYSVALNKFYADRHRYEFRFYWHAVHTGIDPIWIKVSLAVKLFHEDAGEPTLILLMDSDAFVASPDVDLPWWLRFNGIDFNVTQFSIMLAQESKVPNRFQDPLYWNAGVLYMYKDVSGSQRHRDALEALKIWEAAPCQPVCAHLRWNPKLDQGCLEILYKTNPFIGRVVNRTELHMNVFNGPWGQFVRHLWGGVGIELRHVIPQDQAARYLIDVEKIYDQVLQDQNWPTIHYPIGNCHEKH